MKKKKNHRYGVTTLASSILRIDEVSVFRLIVFFFSYGRSAPLPPFSYWDQFKNDVTCMREWLKILWWDCGRGVAGFDLFCWLYYVDMISLNFPRGGGVICAWLILNMNAIKNRSVLLLSDFWVSYVKYWVRARKGTVSKF